MNDALGIWCLWDPDGVYNLWWLFFWITGSFGRNLVPLLMNGLAIKALKTPVYHNIPSKLQYLYMKSAWIFMNCYSFPWLFDGSAQPNTLSRIPH